MMEAEFVAWVRQKVGAHPRLDVGIGDDAAMLSLESGKCVVTSDMLMDGTDFVLSECDPRRVGRKSLGVNLSDIAAMAAKPVAAIVSIAAPEEMPLRIVQDIYEGIFELANKFNVAIAGGDTNRWRHSFAISVTAIGEPTDQGVLTRAGARPGDAIVVTGEFGGSILGRHFDFEPRINEAIALHAKYDIHAAMDVSDGLSLDLSRLAKESNCGAILDERTIPISDDAHRLAQSHPTQGTALEHAFSDGEDFELILAVPNEIVDEVTADATIGVALTKIGEFVEQPGLRLRDERGNSKPLTPRGYEH